MSIIWDLKYIKEIRSKLGLTQYQLAKLSGVSQSLISKIESGNINPSFEVVKKIFEALEKVKVEKGLEIRAGDISTKNLIYVFTHDTVEKAIKLMMKYDISQLPVFKGDKLVGSVTEATIIKKLGEITPNTIVEEIMEDSFPIIPENSSVSLVRQLLTEYQAVLTQKNGRITGIITKADLLKIVK